MSDIKTVHTTEQLLDMWDQASRRNDPHPQLAFARAIESAVLAANARSLNREQISRAAGRVMGDASLRLFMGYIDDALNGSGQ